MAVIGSPDRQLELYAWANAPCPTASDQPQMRSYVKLEDAAAMAEWDDKLRLEDGLGGDKILYWLGQTKSVLWQPELLVCFLINWRI